MTNNTASILDLESSTKKAQINVMGAELLSLKSQESGAEYMWSGDPQIWSGVAPILFPIVGALKAEQYRVGVETFTLERHGFARSQSFLVSDQDADRVVLRLSSNSELRKIYPWEFELRIEFILADSLTINYRIENHDAQDMAFNIGSHPAFRLPLENASISDYQIRFNATETLDCYRLLGNVLDRTPFPYLNKESIIKLTENLFDEDALIFKNITSDCISLEHRIHGPRVKVNTGGAPHLGLWAKPAAPYVCIEPWWGHADFSDSNGDILQKESIQMLPPGQSFETFISIETCAVGA